MLTEKARPVSNSEIKEKGYTEWQNSKIAKELIELNFVALTDNVLDKFFVSSDLPRTNIGKVSDTYLKRYEHIEIGGGWYGRNYDPITHDEMVWFQIKPNTPRKKKVKIGKDWHDTKEIIKYEVPPRAKARIFLPYVDQARWLRIADKYKVSVSSADLKLNFWEWVIKNPKLPIQITEGYKKTLALISQDLICIGLPGVTMGVRTNVDSFLRELQSDVKLFCKGDRSVSIWFDQDKKIKTRKAVNSAIFSLSSMLKKHKCRVSIAEWNEKLGKGIDDVLFNNPNEFDNIIQNKISFDLWSVRHLYKLRKADLTVNARYFSDAVANLPDTRLLALKSPQNTGKTYVIIQKVQDALSKGYPVIVLTHLESLARALSKKFGVPYRTESDPTLSKAHYGYSLCIDSFMRKTNGFDPEDWGDNEIVLIIDEVEQVLQHLMIGNTVVKDFRPTIFNTLWESREKIHNAIIADADLSDVSVNFFESFLTLENEDPCTAYIIENTYKFEGMEFFKYEKQRDLLGYALECLDKGEKLFIGTTSQKPKSKFGTIALENLLREKYPEKRILRIDSETIEDPNHDSYQCLKHLNQLLVNYDVVLVSPSICTGVSIDIYGHFDKVIAFSQGNISPQSFLQMMWRLRDGVERHFYCTPAGNGYIGNSSSIPTDVLRSTQDTADFAIRFLGGLDAQVKLDDHSGCFLEAWAKIAARINASNRCYSDLLDSLILAQGHSLYGSDDVEAVDSDEVKKNAKKCQDTRNELIMSRPNIDEEEAKAIENKKSRTLEELTTLKKYQTKKKYGKVSKEILEFDDDGKFSQLKLFYYLTVGDLFTHAHDLKRINTMSENNDKKAISHDVARAVVSPKVQNLKSFDILGLLEYCLDQGVVTAKDERLEKFYNIVKPYRKSLKNLSINVSKDSPIRTVNSFLKQIGFKLSTIGVIRVGKDTMREYQLEVLPSFTFDILLEWFYRDKCENPELVYNSSVTQFPIYKIEKLLKITQSDKQTSNNNAHDNQRGEVVCG